MTELTVVNSQKILIAVLTHNYHIHKFNYEKLPTDKRKLGS
jgi:hypothetical protein